MENKKFSIVEALKFGLSTTLEHILFFLGMFVTWFAAFLGLSTIVGLIAAPYLSKFLEYISTTEVGVIQSRDFALRLVQQAPSLVGILFSGFFVVVFLFKLLATYLMLGLVKVSLEFYDLHTATFKSLFMQARYLVRSFIATGLYALMVLLGLTLFIVPGIIWAIQFGFVNQLIVDKNMSIFQAFHASSDLTRRARLHLFGLFFVLYVINILASLLLGILLCFTIPLTVLAWTYAYRKLQALPAVRSNR